MKKILIIEPSSSGTKLIDACRQLGHSPIVLTANRDDRKIDKSILANADEVHLVDTNNYAASLLVVQDLKKRIQIDAIIPGFEYYIPLAAELNEAFGTPGLDRETALNVRHKHRMRTVIANAGLRSPRFATVTTVQEGLMVGREIGFPLVIKPVAWSGSLMVRRVDDEIALASALKTICEESFSEYGMPPLKQAILEEYVKGREFSVEGFVLSGNVNIVAITDKFLGAEPHFVETGHITPALIEEGSRQTIEDYVSSVVRALRITVGPFHCEIRVNEQGPVFIEIGARLGGDHICDLVFYAKNIDLYRTSVACYLGDKDVVARQLEAMRDHQYCGIRYFIRPGLSRYRIADYERPLYQWPELREFYIDIPAGQNIPPAESSLGRIGYVIATDRDHGALERRLSDIDQSIRFV
ncbi:ATP-grasp domain-containing protein [Paraburkholderia sp. Ac-20340]|uniref:ATP-grasp domain-containing protein n=1 Tax=Paraburkholderia sp. Ac-20340 TaxID=2703888 RepID=UPI0019818FC1|nr:ATP-grasp domain-containing protein [Paraburkholderia sp. Ac-20340]MBN3855655.1 ATP-grasp domain-containing protein [Paraburkholderia sp. Ac-20340]